MREPIISTRKRTQSKKKKKKFKKKVIITSLVSFIVAMPLVGWILVDFWLNSWTSLFDFDHTSDRKNFSASVDREDDGDIDLGDLNAYLPPENDVYKDEDVLNVLLIGTDERHDEFHENARADSMMILSLNFKT